MVSRCNADDLISPINISKNNIVTNCNIKCSLVTNYNNSSVNVHNKGNYVSFDYDSNTTTNYHIKFNSIKMNVNEVRVYFPSIHSYNNSKADAELLIIHSGNGSNCIVSIPIVAGDPLTIGEKTLGTILENVVSAIPNDNESTSLNISNFDISKLLQLNVPYYYYQGQLVFEPCTQNYNYIVFDKNDVSLHVSENIISQLALIFKQATGSVAYNKDLKNLSYNKNGATSVELEGTDDIYIECKPVDIINQEGVQIDTPQTAVASTTTANSNKSGQITFDTLSKNPAFDVVVSFIGLFILYSTGKYALSYFKTRNK